MPSADFITQMNLLRGANVIPKVELILDDGTTDITSYFINGGDFDQQREREVDRISSGDISFVFSNHTEYFSDKVTTSVFYCKTYIGRQIRYSIGLRLPTGVIEYISQFTAIIQNIEIQQESNQVTIYCRDNIYKIVNSTLNPISNVLQWNTGGLNNINLTSVAIYPFSTTTYTFQTTGVFPIQINFLSATTFDVWGYFLLYGSTYGWGRLSASENINTLVTAGDGTGFIRFEVSPITTPNIGDAYAINATRLPEFANTNVIKILWALLTGYDFDTDIQQPWSAGSLGFDHTKSNSNTDLNYNAFVKAIAETPDLILTGFVPFDSTAVDIISGLLALCLGSFFADGDGRIDINVYSPSLGSTPLEFSDQKQLTKIYYRRNIDYMVNYCTGTYRISNAWDWSDASAPTPSIYSASNSSSITTYKKQNNFSFDCSWYSATNPLINMFARLLDREGTPPIEVEFWTGLDALTTNIGDIIKVTETKSGLSSHFMEVYHIKKSLGQDYKEIVLQALDSPYGVNWAFLGSSADEGDGMGWQVGSSQTYDTATTIQKQYCYLSTTSSGTDPMYYLW